MDWSVEDTGAEKAPGYYTQWERSFFGVGFVRRQYGDEPNENGRLYGVRLFSLYFFFRHEPPYRPAKVHKVGPTGQ